MTAAKVLVIGEDPTVRQVVASALECSIESVRWMTSLDAAESALASGSAGQVPVAVLSNEFPDKPAKDFAEMVACVAPATSVVLLRNKAVGSSFAALVRSGIRDVVDMRQGDDELREALNRAMSWSASLQSMAGDSRESLRGLKGHVICTFSSKGGTGKSFLATNLATAIAKRTGKDIALVDLDMAIGDAFSYFGQDATRPIQDLIALGNKVDRRAIEASATNFAENLWGFGAPADPAAADVSPEAITKVLTALASHYDVTVVDSPAGYTDQVLAALDMAHQICLVAGLDVVGIKHLVKAIETLTSIGVPRERMVVCLNRADSKVGLEPGDIEKLMGIEIDAMIPSSRLVPMSLNKGVPVYIGEPTSPVAQSIDELVTRLIPADMLQPVVTAQSAKKPLFRRFFGTEMGGVSDVAS